MSAWRARLSAIGNASSNGDRGAADAAAARLRRPLDRAFLRHVTSLGALERLGASVATAAPPPLGPRVLALSLRGWPAHAGYEAVIAQALRLRGAGVATLSCGGGQPVCELGWARRAHPRPCDRCAWLTDATLGATGLDRHRLGDELAWGRDARRAPHEPPGDGEVDPGAASRVSLAWFLRTSDTAAAPESAAAQRDFAVATAEVARAAGRLLDRERPDVVFALNGLFAAERAICEVARTRGIRVVTYEIAPRAGALVFSQGSPAPEYDNDEAWATLRDQPLLGTEAGAIERLLADRARGVGAHERYFDAPEARLDALRARLDLAPGTRVVSLFTNLTWDSATLEHDIGFASMLDWVQDAAQLAGERDDTTLVIRIHPAERRWRTREEVIPLLAARFGGRLPDNVRLVDPDEALSTYALVDLSELVLVYTTTVGLEAAARGVPVAVAGRTHYRGRGFTIDLDGRDDLRAALAARHERLAPEAIELAHRYAYTFFFRCSIPFPAVRVHDGRVVAAPDAAAAIAPGADAYVDFVCDRILDGGPFVLPSALALGP
jgi:hypothetical protein